MALPKTHSCVMALLLALTLIGVGCAKGSELLAGGGPGEGGSGGQGAGTVTSETVSTIGAGGGGGGATTTTTETETDTTSTSSSSSSSSTTSSSTTSTTNTDCPSGQHECAGQCVGNTPQSGCLQSVSCTPCSPPANGTSSCTPAGACDFTCQSGYTKQGATCVCSAGCCSNADCGANQTCVSGTCMDSGGGCNSDDCVGGCLADCILMGKFGGLGICLGNTCQCTCLDPP